MKTSATIKRLMGIAVCLLLLAPTASMAQETKEKTGKLPITTSSLEAKRLFIEGRDAMELLQFTKAIDRLDEAIRIDPKFAQAHLYLSVSKTGMKYFDPEELEHAVKYAPMASPGERDLIHFANAYIERDNQKMEKYLDKLSKSYDTDERVHSWIGMYYYDKADYTRALRHFNRARFMNSNHHFAVRMIGYANMGMAYAGRRVGSPETDTEIVYEEMDQLGEAKKAFKDYIDMRPDNAAPYDAYGEYLGRRGKFSAAIRYYEKALKINPEFTTSYKGLADNYLFRGDFLRARENYKKYFNKSFNTPDQFQALLLEASVELQEDNTTAAMKVMDQYIDLAEKKNLPRYKIYGLAHKGYILSETGNPREGLRYYRQAKKMVNQEDLDESYRTFLDKQTNIWEFYGLVSNGNMEEAEVARQRSLADISEKTNVDQWKLYQASCGIMEIKKGNYREARKHLQDSWENMPMVWYYMGLSWEKSGNKNRASHWYEKVANHYVNSLEMGAVRNKALAGLKKNK